MKYKKDPVNSISNLFCFKMGRGLVKLCFQSRPFITYEKNILFL